MGKTLVYIVLLSILGFGVYYFIIRDKDGLYQEAEANFTFRDTASIGKIFLVNNEGKSILLERQADNKWLLNKLYPAMPLQMVNILTCLKMQTALMPVSANEHDRVVKLLAGLSTKVEVYNRSGEKIKTFYVGGQGPNYHGSYMITENAQQAYLVEIPGFDGYLSPRYTVDLNDWRSRSMIDWGLDSLASISIRYAENPSNSFTLINGKGAPTVSIDSSLTKKYTALNVRRTLSYLTFFKNINAEGFLNGTMGLDSIIAHTRLRCQLKVQNTTGNEKSFDIYWIPSAGKALYDAAHPSAIPGQLPVDVERMYAVDVRAKDTLLIQSRTFDKLLRNAPEFYTASPAQ